MMINDKYWTRPPDPGKQDLVVIHVCDEARQVNRDFCCKRDILVNYMKYFEKFLAENENGYEDIDISVHCDVEIFEWLMSYIHSPEVPPELDKSIVVSILISSEFLQMDGLVDKCLEHISGCLNDIIKLPIDLSCISEKLVNKLASLTHPNILAVTKDRKDKILNKLYKRRVEIDFSRKSTGKNGVKTIATSLNCCKHCGNIYLDSYVNSLKCPSAPSSISFRGVLCQRHNPVSGWSLTAYLKALHIGGMGWDAIYWHVWASCIVLQASDIVISALEVDRYTISNDGLIISRNSSLDKTTGVTEVLSNISSMNYSLNSRNINGKINNYKLTISNSEERIPAYNHITPSLCPTRSPFHLTPEIFELISSQMKYIAAVNSKALIESTSRTLLNSLINDSQNPTENLAWGSEICDLLWGDVEIGNENSDNEKRRGRSRSPMVRNARKQFHSLSKVRGSNDDSSGKEFDVDYPERRSRSISTGLRNGKKTGNLLSNGMNSNSNSQGGQGPNSLGNNNSSSINSSNLSSGGSMGGDHSSGGGTGDSFHRDNNNIIVGSSDERGDEQGDYEERLEYDAIISNLPPETYKTLLASKGHLRSHGIIFGSHLLQSIPNAMNEMIIMAQESNLSDNKKQEWTLDIIREFDEKRFERFESYLISLRSSQPDIQFEPVNKSLKQAVYNKRRAEEGKNSNRYNGEYYKDRGRFPSRQPL